jgi:hypothetical protein
VRIVGSGGFQLALMGVAYRQIGMEFGLSIRIEKKRQKKNIKR